MGRIRAESMLLQQGSMTLDSCSLSLCGRKEQRLNRWPSRLHLAGMCTSGLCWQEFWVLSRWRYNGSVGD